MVCWLRFAFLLSLCQALVVNLKVPAEWDIQSLSLQVSWYEPQTKELFIPQSVALWPSRGSKCQLRSEGVCHYPSFNHHTRQVSVLPLLPSHHMPQGQKCVPQDILMRFEMKDHSTGASKSFLLFQPQAPCHAPLTHSKHEAGWTEIPQMRILGFVAVPLILILCVAGCKRRKPPHKSVV